MSDKFVLYDLACRGRCACWSPNVWKIRLVLNYKGIPYRAEWLNHMNIGPTLKDLGVPARTSGPGSPHTVPALQWPDGGIVMDSADIVQKLESDYPDHGLHLDTGLQDKVGAILGKIMPPLLPCLMPVIGRDVIVESSMAEFQESRSKRFGMPLDEVERTLGGDKAWQAARPGLEELNAFMTEHKKDEGPFVLGSQVSYADFLVVSTMEALRRISKDLSDNFVKDRENLVKVHQASQRWIVDDQ